MIKKINSNKYEIDKATLKDLLRSEHKISALTVGGVEKWEFFKESIDGFESFTEWINSTYPDYEG